MDDNTQAIHDRPHFLHDAPATPEAAARCDADMAGMGFVMNVTRLWNWQPATIQAFSEMLDIATKDHLSFRERGLIVLATASTIGDSYCSTAWGNKMAPVIGADAAAGVLQGDDVELTPKEQALTSWVRRVMRSATTTTTDDIDELRRAGYDDAAIFALTFFAAMRMAFSTVNNALGAHPDGEFHSAAPQVLGAIDYGRPMGPDPAATT